MPSEFTVDQARDLARYFLGSEWDATNLGTPGVPVWRLFRLDPFIYHDGSSWREAFRLAGVKLPMRPRYTAQGSRVMMEDRAICTAVTNTMAKRIAGALNEYVPDRRGI